MQEEQSWRAQFVELYHFKEVQRDLFAGKQVATELAQIDDLCNLKVFQCLEIVPQRILKRVLEILGVEFNEAFSQQSVVGVVCLFVEAAVQQNPYNFSLLRLLQIQPVELLKGFKVVF